MPYITNQQRVVGAYVSVLSVIMGLKNKADYERYIEKLIAINERYGDNYQAADNEIAEFAALKREISGKNIKACKVVKETASEDLPF